MSKLVIIIIFKKVKKLTVEIKIGEIFTDQNSLQIKLFNSDLALSLLGACLNAIVWVRHL